MHNVSDNKNRDQQMGKVLSSKVDKILKNKVLLALSASKINDSTNFKINFGRTSMKNCTRKKKVEHEAYFKTIKI